jgi:protein-S-isoprenylcysteine O-methyltransferase Ste14
VTRALYILFGLAAYLLFFLTFLYLIAFIGDLSWVDMTVDRGGVDGSALSAAVIDLGLVALFGVQHSVMARPGFKRAWTRIVPEPLERSVYVLIASMMLVVVIVAWRPIPATVWDTDNSTAAALIYTLFALGWLIVLVSTLLLSHSELFGLKQVWNHAHGADAVEPTLRTPLFYKLVRHPLYSGFLIAFWAIPHMTVGHLLFATTMLTYVLIAIGYEERDLVSVFGRDYEAYRRQVGRLTPRLGRGTR